MKQRSLSVLLIAILVLGLFPALASRWLWEEDNQTVTILFDSWALEALALDSETDLDGWTEALCERGLGGLAVREETLTRLKERGVLTWLTKKQALASPYWTLAYPQTVLDWLNEPEEGILVALWDKNMTDWLTGSLSRRAIPFTRWEGSGMTYLLLSGKETLSDLPLGIWPETIDLAAKFDLSLCPVLELPELENTAALAKSLYQEWTALDCPTLLCLGSQVPGWNEDQTIALSLLEDYLQSGGSLTLIERSEQRGSLDFDGKEDAMALANSLLLRCFYQWDYVSNRYAALGYSDGREVSLALARAAAERNCRILWLQPMVDNETGKTVEGLENYLDLFRQLTVDLRRFGLETGQPNSGAQLGRGIPTFVRQTLSWFTAAGTDCICAWLLIMGRRSWGLVIGTQLLALLGGLAASAWMATNSFFLGEDIFRGVKVAQVLPLALFLFLWGRNEWCRSRAQVRTFLKMPVSGKVLVCSWLIAGCCALSLVIGWYYLARTGNSGLATDLELRLRNLLEELCIARPRFKEFALGLPCLVLWCRGRPGQWTSLLFGLGAMIGLTSVTNTFLHLCTPLRLSLIRTGMGWLLGGIIAILFLALWRWGRRTLWPAS